MPRSRPRETMDYLPAAARFIRAAGRRCAVGDEPELLALVALHDEVDAALDVAVAAWIEQGRSWADVARGLGMTRQAAHKRFSARGRPVEGAA